MGATRRTNRRNFGNWKRRSIANANRTVTSWRSTKIGARDLLRGVVAGQRVAVATDVLRAAAEDEIANLLGLSF